MNKKVNKGLEETVKDALAEQLGIEPEDIKENDSLVSDLLMRPSEISDFITHLEGLGIETSDLNLSEIETLDELIERLKSQEDI